MKTIEEYIYSQIVWSLMTFGEGLRTKGLIEHIKKELAEIEEQPFDLVEWIDVIILAMDGYWRHGGTAEEFMKLLSEKHEINKRRLYPKVSEDEPSLHIK